MPPPAPKVNETKETTLQRTLVVALNELGMEAAVIALFEREQGQLIPHASRGFAPREIQAIVRSLSGTEWKLEKADADSGESQRILRLKLITPTAKALMGVPLRYKQRTYGVLVVGRKESAVFLKKEKSLIETASDDITKALEQASIFNSNLILGRPFVSDEPAPVSAANAYVAPPAHSTPERQEQIATWLHEGAEALHYERAWVNYYDPLAGTVEVVGIWGSEPKPEQKKELKPGQRLTLDTSAAGWAVRHRKPRIDHDLASTQGRFLDHKPLYRDRFRSTIAVPFFLRGQVGGTITLVSKNASQYTPQDAGLLEPLMAKLLTLFQEQPAPRPATEPTQASVTTETPAAPVTAAPPEPLIRKQERQDAIMEFSAFLATEVREPLGSVRAQLEEVTAEGTLDFDPQTKVENAMRDIIRIEAIINEILDFAKPLELNRRTCRIVDVIENALTVVATDLEANRIHVVKDYATPLNPTRCDDAKLQQVFLSIIKNALEAMTPGGTLTLSVTQQRAGRNQELQIIIKNNGVPIPAEHVDKVFEPFFSTKRSGTGLGLATVKKIVEEHQGQLGIASAPSEGTTVTIRLPALVRRAPFRHRGRGRRPAAPKPVSEG